MSEIAKMRAQMESGAGFIAALDQSGGSTPKALGLYGVDASEYGSEEEMFAEIQKMRARIILAPDMVKVTLFHHPPHASFLFVPAFSPLPDLVNIKTQTRL